MPSIDLLQFVERFLGALTNFAYSICGSIRLLIARPAYSGRGAYADYDGADMLRRLTPGWGGELSWELGRVLMGSLAATAISDAAARLLATLGWPLVPSLRGARRHTKTRGECAVQAAWTRPRPANAC